jgi:hypothetical protein
MGPFGPPWLQRHFADAASKLSDAQVLRSFRVGYPSKYLLPCSSNASTSLLLSLSA